MVEDVFRILGTTLAGTFHIEEVIAEGGFGVVYRAEHVAFRAPVALKCLKIPGTISPSQSEMFVENFREEAEILFHLSAQIPEVVRPLHADAMTLEDGTFVPYIAMEWVEGKPLDSIVIMREEDGLAPLALRKVIKMLLPIAHALHKAHRFQVPGGAIVSVTHCDLKPENILITERDSPVRAKVLDFGIAKARDMMRQNVGRITDSETSRPFTPSYGAPEQWVPKRYGQSGPWTDVWGLALTMCECLTGRPPIDGDMHAMMGTCLDKARRPSPRSEGADISAEVDAVFIKALAVDPRDRYNDIESFWSDLEDAALVPSSFDRARKRRERPTYGGVDRPSAPNEPLEFDGLELVDEGSIDEGSIDKGSVHKGSVHAGSVHKGSVHAPEVAAPAPRAAVDSGRSFSADPMGLGDDIKPSSDNEFELEEAPHSADGPGSFDLDLSESPPPASPLSRPRAAVTSGSWAQPDLARSGSHPALSRSGSHAALTRSGQYNAPPGSLRGHQPAAAMQSSSGGLAARLRTPIILVVLGLVLTGVDMALAKTMGGTLSLGPVRLRWIAAGLAAVGIVMAFWNLLGDKHEDE